MIDKVKDGTKYAFSKKFYLLSRKKIEKKKKNKKRSDEIKVNFIEENITCCQKNVSKSWKIWREDASRLMEWRMKRKGGKDATRTRKCAQFTASGCHKQNTFQKEGFE